MNFANVERMAAVPENYGGIRRTENEKKGGSMTTLSVMTGPDLMAAGIRRPDG